jgi:hypothetical protein
MKANGMYKLISDWWESLDNDEDDDEDDEDEDQDPQTESEAEIPTTQEVTSLEE